MIIFGDDPYENFKEDCIPPFAHGLPGFGGENNIRGEPTDATFVHRGDKPFAMHIATELMERDFPISYAFTNSHHAEQHGPAELTHAFLNALLFLDWDCKGFEYPVVSIQVNAYGKDVMPNRGVIAHLDPKTKSEPFGDQLGPSAPSAASRARHGRLLRNIPEARQSGLLAETCPPSGSMPFSFLSPW